MNLTLMLHECYISVRWVLFECNISSKWVLRTNHKICQLKRGEPDPSSPLCQPMSAFPQPSVLLPPQFCQQINCHPPPEQPTCWEENTIIYLNDQYILMRLVKIYIFRHFVSGFNSSQTLYTLCQPISAFAWPFLSPSSANVSICKKKTPLVT